MPQFPPNIHPLELPGLKRIHSGKVRDTFDLGNGLLLMVTSDRISALDFVLSCEIDLKGSVLNAMSIYWSNFYAAHGYNVDLVAYGGDIDKYLPEELRDNPELQKIAVVCQYYEHRLPIEAVVRGCLTGSGWSDYKKNRIVSGHELPMGLFDGSGLEPCIFTPSTKEDEGHDEPIDYKKVVEELGQGPRAFAEELFLAARDRAAARDIIIADTKFEFALKDPSKQAFVDNLVLIDEKVTPDSSRFWTKKDWQRTVARNSTLEPNDQKPPPSLDKEPVREFLKRNGVTTKSKSEDVWRLDFSQILVPTSTRYQEAFLQLTGERLQSFQRNAMGIHMA